MIPLPAALAFVAAALDPAPRAWPKRRDWEAIANLANNQLVTPALYQSLSEQDRLAELPADLVEGLLRVTPGPLVPGPDLDADRRDLELIGLLAVLRTDHLMPRVAQLHAHHVEDV